jgi:hypothetical protein
MSASAGVRCLVSAGKRREMDLMKLMMSDWKVDLVNDSVCEFTVLFKGPPDSEQLCLHLLACSSTSPADGAPCRRGCTRGRWCTPAAAGPEGGSGQHVP